MSVRVLAIDCGNSRLKWGVHEKSQQGTRWLAQGVLAYADLPGLADVLRVQASVTQALVCNVAGDRVGGAVRTALDALGVPQCWLKSQSSQHGVCNLYDDPAQLGADRWAALIGARALHGAACLVVCAGTATTVDVLDDAGNFQGGVILPGIELMRRSLADNTAQLPLVEGRLNLPARNTVDAIVSGCLLAQAGAIERMFEQVRGSDNACCLVSGGAAAQLADLLRLPVRPVDNLVLEGLACIAAE